MELQARQTANQLVSLVGRFPRSQALHGLAGVRAATERARQTFKSYAVFSDPRRLTRRAPCQTSA